MKKRMICVALFLVCLCCVLSVSAAQNVVSLHKSYELVTSASEGYPDTSGELTNGKYGTPVPNGDVQYYYRDPEYVGFNRSSVNTDGNFVIVLDLADPCKDLSSFELGYLNETDIGIYAPTKVAFYISNELSENYTFVGERALSESTAAGQQKAGIAEVIPETPVSGRYVMCVITPRDKFTTEDGQERTATWTFIDEITVLQGQNPLDDESKTETTSSAESSADMTSSVPMSSASVSTESASVPSRPGAGDRSVLLFVLLCGVSGLLSAALISRRTR